MNWFVNFCHNIGVGLGVDEQYIVLILGTILILLVAKAIKIVGNKIIVNNTSEEKRYNINRNFKLVINICEVIVLFFVWDNYISNLMTLVSVLSAGLAIALKDIILNWFCGIYIRFNKPFRVEDRVEINNIKGDVINMGSLEFELLEVKDEEFGQSTGVVITLPNSFIFLYSLKNYTKGFKYIWNELIVKVKLDSDLNKTEKELYRIIDDIEEINKVPKKTEQQINNITDSYRIYYNNYDPHIYTRIVDGHIELIVRYLMNPKKARLIESEIWTKILDSYNKGIIKLYKED